MLLPPKGSIREIVTVSLEGITDVIPDIDETVALLKHFPVRMTVVKFHLRKVVVEVRDIGVGVTDRI